MGIDIIIPDPPKDPSKDPSKDRLDVYKEMFDLISNFEDNTLTDDQKKMAPNGFSFVRGDTTEILLSPDKYLKYENQLLTDLLSNYDGIFDRSGFLRIEPHIIALYIYILNKFKYSSVGSELSDKSLYDIITNQNISTENMSDYNDFMETLAEILYVYQVDASTSRLVDQFYVLLQQVNENIIDTNVVERMKTIIAHIKGSEFTKFTAGEFFEMKTVFGKKTGSVYSLIFDYATIEGYTFNDPKEVCAVRQSLLLFMCAHFVEDDITLGNMANILKSYNPQNCTIIRDDLMTLISFKEFPFSDIYEIVSVSPEHCYTYNYLAKMVVMNNGILNISSYVSDLKKLTDNMGSYYFKHQDVFNSFLRPDIIALYDKVKCRLHDNAKYFKPFSSISQAPTEKPTDPKKQLQDFFNYIMVLHNVNLNTTVVEDLMLRGGSSIMDLIGLLGYICYSDDIVNGDQNEDAKHFMRSSYCIELTRTFLNTYNLNEISMNNKHLKSIIDSKECIHGIGTKLIEFYVNCMYYVTIILNKVESVIEDPERNDHNSFTTKLLNALGVSLDSPDAMEMIRSNFKLAPFLIEIPPSMTSTGFGYMTLVRDDNIVQRNPLLNRYIVTAFNIWGGMKTTLIDCTNTFSVINPHRSTLNFMIPSGSYNIFPYDQTPLSQLTTTLIQHDTRTMIDLVRVSYTFQRNRALRFRLFIEYTKNMIEVISQPPGTSSSCLYSRIKEIASKPTYDFINLTETKLPLKYLTILDLSNTQGHMYGNSRIKTIGKDYYVDTVENVINMQYQPDPDNTSDKRPGVLLLHQGGNNITRQYEYCKVLATMLYRNVYLSNVTVFPFYNENNYYDYNKKMYSLFENYVLNLYGQSSSFRTRMFKNLKFVVNIIPNINLTFTMQNNFNYLESLLENENMSKRQDKQAIMDALFYILGQFKQLDMINAPEILKNLMNYGDLLKNYPNILPSLHGILSGLTKLINDILSIMRIFMFTVISYYAIIMPANDVSFHGLWRIPFLVTQDESEKQNVWLNQYTASDKSKSLDLIRSIQSKYNLIISEVIAITCKYGSFPNTFQYHFTEISKEVHFLKYIDKLVTEKTKTGSSSPHQDRMEAAFDVLKTTIPYYSDYASDEVNEVNEVLQLLQSDYAESQREVFDCLAKIDIMNAHNLRMAQFIQLENILCNIFDNILSTYNYEVTEVQFDVTDQVNQHFCQTIVSKCKEGCCIRFICANIIQRAIILNRDYDVPFIIFQKIYFGCLDMKTKLDIANQREIEKDKIFNKIRNIWLTINSSDDSSQNAVTNALKQLNDAFTPYQGQSEARTPKNESYRKKICNLAKLISSYSTCTNCQKDDRFNQRKQRFDAAKSIFEYTYKWIQSMEQEEDFHKHIDSLIRMIESTINVINARIESIPSSNAAGASTSGSASKGGKKKRTNKNK